MNKVVLTISSSLIIVFISISGVQAQSQKLGDVNRCKSNQARAYRYVLESGIKFMPDYENLKSYLSQLNTDDFCECLFRGFANLGTTDHLTQKTQEDEVCFACFGQQWGQPNLKPPAPNEQNILQAVSRMAPEGSATTAIQKTKTILASLTTALKMYQTLHQQLPSSLSDLANPQSGLIKPELLKDAWGHTITFKNLGKAFQLISAGPDGQIGTKDDLTR